ncbi:hypothetical protein [Allobaculum mucilyticum]|nr:hypothetical protein [Allobaculum mucilyticum]UNT95250.1 hypothetical protein KWG62_07760 [Allobaculum mucilyticum]
MSDTLDHAKRLQAMLDTGRPLRLAGLPVLVQKKGDRIALSAPEYTLRLDPEDFQKLYGSYEAVFVEEKQGIDAEKDEEYYAWRREKQ